MQLRVKLRCANKAMESRTEPAGLTAACTSTRQRAGGRRRLPVPAGEGDKHHCIPCIFSCSSRCGSAASMCSHICSHFTPLQIGACAVRTCTTDGRRREGSAGGTLAR